MTKLKLIVVILIFTSFLSIPAYAGWLDESITDTSTPSESNLANGVWAWGGGRTIRIPSTTVQPVNIMMPKVDVGCGGIDAFWGGFSFMDPDRIVQYGQNILAAAPAYVFELALENLCSDCHAIMGHLNKLANTLNSATMDSCAAAQNTMKFIGTKLNMDTWLGNRDGTGKGYEDDKLSTAASYISTANDIFTNWLTNNEAEPFEKMIVVPDLDNHFVSFWVSAVANKMSTNDFQNYQAGWEAAANFFDTPVDFINFARAVTGDILSIRGATGVEGSNNAGTIDSTTPSETIKLQKIESAFDRLYGNYETIIRTISGNDMSAQPVTSTIYYNEIMGLGLSGYTPGASYTTSTSQGYNGFNLGANISPSTVIVMLNWPITGENTTPFQYAQNLITTIFNNIDDVGGANPTDLDNFILFKSLPVYTLTNHVSLIASKYPAIIGQVTNALSELAAASYANARLNECLAYMTKMVEIGEKTINSLASKQYPGIDIQQYREWLKQAKTNIKDAIKYNNDQMQKYIDANLTDVSDEIKRYLEIEQKIITTVAGSSFSAMYATER